MLFLSKSGQSRAAPTQLKAVQDLLRQTEPSTGNALSSWDVHCEHVDLQVIGHLSLESFPTIFLRCYLSMTDLRA